MFQFIVIGKEMSRSLTHDVKGEIRKEPVVTPKSIRGSRPNAVPNKRVNYSIISFINYIVN